MRTTKFIGIEPPSPTIKYQNFKYEICYILKERTDCGEYQWYIIKLDQLDYGNLVDEIIHIYYSDSQMTAIINNYLLDGESEEYLKMQEIRKQVKSEAKLLINQLEEEN